MEGAEERSQRLGDSLPERESTASCVCAECAHDARLEAEVDDSDERSVRLIARIDLARRGRDLGDEVLILPAREATGGGHGRAPIHLSGRADETPDNSGVSRVFGPRVK